MSKKWGAKITGMTETLQNAHNLGFNVKACVRTAVNQQAGTIMTAAKRRAKKQPTGVFTGTPSGDPEPGTPTGRLSGSITMASNFSQGVRGLKSPAEASDAVRAPGGDGDASPRVAVGTNTDYAEFVEKGTKKMEPRPYLYPAFFAHENDLPAILKAVVEKKKALSYFKTTLPYFDAGGIED
jgi:HK97 gp10 family phage protein